MADVDMLIQNVYAYQIDYVADSMERLNCPTGTEHMLPEIWYCTTPIRNLFCMNFSLFAILVWYVCVMCAGYGHSSVRLYAICSNERTQIITYVFFCKCVACWTWFGASNAGSINKREEFEFVPHTDWVIEFTSSRMRPLHHILQFNGSNILFVSAVFCSVWIISLRAQIAERRMWNIFIYLLYAMNSWPRHTKCPYIKRMPNEENETICSPTYPFIGHNLCVHRCGIQMRMK